MDVFLVNGYYLDKEQQEAVLCDAKNVLLLAGAGTGKTMTIVGKVRYLLSKGILPDEILCISFTNATVDHLKDIFLSYGYDIDVFTFHKLALSIISKYEKVNIASDLLSYLIEEYFNTLIFQDEPMLTIVLYYYNKFIFLNAIKTYKSICIDDLKSVILRFVTLFKSNNYNESLFFDIYKQSGFKNKCLILIIYKIYKLYEEELKSSSSYDFDDLIVVATNIVKNNDINMNYKYIIVDEFQDTSLTKYNFLKSLLNVTNASLFAVGDDFQSIYKFTGCDLDLFLNFENNYSDAVVKRISTTYRNSNQLIKCCSNFIMKNSRQMKKDLVAIKDNLKPFKFVFYKDKKKAFIRILSLINTDIMVIGRNNFDINSVLSCGMILDKNSIKYLDKDIRYYTAHTSKGLEASNTILINNSNDKYGFPSKVKNSSVFKFIYKEDKYLYEEERRLFYVALTRTRNNVYLMIPCFSFSRFILEFIFNYYKYIEFYFY